METSIQDILFNLCKEYDISEEQIGPIKRKLKKEFYFKLKDIKNLTKEEIDQGLNVIDREIKDRDQQREVLGLIEGVIHNLLNHPNEEKYKKININKIRRKYPYDSIMSFFSLIRFKRYEDPSFIKYTKEPSWLDNVIPLMYAHYNIPYDKNKEDISCCYNWSVYKTIK